MILVCAATGTEADACRRGIADSGAPDLAVLTTGVGPARARAALASWLRDPPSPKVRPSLVVSSGFAGVLSLEIELLTWVTASAVYRIVNDRPDPVVLPPGLLRAAGGATACHVLSAGRVVAQPPPGLSHPCAVDMESAALAEVAAAAGVPFMVLRLVTDAPGRPLVPFVRSIAAMLAAAGMPERAAHGTRAALDAVRSPAATLAFLRDTALWRERLRAGWREYAGRGIGT